MDGGRREKAADGTVYFRGSVRSELAGRDHAIALTCIGGPGNPGAAVATAGAIAAYDPRAVLLMGIAAGIRNKIDRTCSRKHEVAVVLDRPDASADQAVKVLEALAPFMLLVDDADILGGYSEGSWKP